MKLARCYRGAATYGWDILNRMTSYTSGSATNYTYRPDGLRATKVNSSENTTYFYDGQMAIEEQSVRGAITDVKRYGIGARGLDIIDITRNGNPYEVQFPMYDGHGNQVGTLRRNGSAFVIGNLRAYDAWGIVNYENFLDADQQTRPKEKYCANLGHKADDESSLIYMRARYYEPTTGRFVSEDPARAGNNWCAYADNNPIANIDPTGKVPLPPATLQYLLTKFLSNAALGQEAWTIGQSALIMWMAWLQLDRDGIAQIFGRDQKVAWVSEAEAGLIATRPLVVTDVRTKAQALADMYSTCLWISMWILDDVAFKS